MAEPLRDIRPAFSLEKRNYIVTGGAQGIGLGVVRAIAEFGGNVAVLDVKERALEEYEKLADRFGVRTIYIQTDVSSEESLTHAFDKAVDFLGSVDGAFTSAGIAIDKPFVEQTWNEALKIQQVNVCLSMQ